MRSQNMRIEALLASAFGNIETTDCVYAPPVKQITSKSQRLTAPENRLRD